MRVLADDGLAFEAALLEQTVDLVERSDPLVPLEHEPIGEREELGRVADEIALEASTSTLSTSMRLPPEMFFHSAATSTAGMVTALLSPFDGTSGLRSGCAEDATFDGLMKKVAVVTPGG